MADLTHREVEVPGGIFHNYTPGTTFRCGVRGAGGVGGEGKATAWEVCCRRPEGAGGEAVCSLHVPGVAPARAWHHFSLCMPPEASERGANPHPNP